MLQNAYLLAKIGADTAENERNFAENLPIGCRVAAPYPGGGSGGPMALQGRPRRAPRGLVDEPGPLSCLAGEWTISC